MSKLPPRPDESELEPELPESDSAPAKKPPVEGYLDFLSNQGIEIDQQSWQRFFRRVETADLKNDPLSQQFAKSEMKVLAKLSGDTLLLSPEFDQLDQERQRYILAHEHGHRLETLFSRSSPERYQAISQLLTNLPGKQVSHYVHHLETKIEADPTLTIHLNREKFAETIAQYLTGGRNFAGMIESKLNQFPPDPNVVIEAYRREAEESGVGELKDYLNQADDLAKQEDFFAHHPDLKEQYQLFQILHQTFSDPQALTWPEAEGEMPDWEGDADFYDTDELVNYFPQPSAAQRPATKPGARRGDESNPASWWNIFNFFQIFPPSNKER